MTEQLDPDSPYAPNGVEWWRLENYPGSNRRFGGEKRIAAWLWFNAEVGHTFTMRQIRIALGDGTEAEAAEQLNRRLRNLRPDDWVITSYKDDRSLLPDTYRLDAKGKRVWLGERNPKLNISLRTRRLVFERDGSRCTICGIGDGESYPEAPGATAKMTVGHRIPRERGGSDLLDNLQTECSWCNEPARHEIPDPETYDEVFAEVRNLRKDDLKSILSWLASGQRSRSKLDIVYDRARKLSKAEQDAMMEAVQKMLPR